MSGREDHLFAMLDAEEDLAVGNDEEFGTIHRLANGVRKATSQFVEYTYRGDDLCFLSLVEYACIIRRIDDPMPEESRGKKL